MAACRPKLKTQPAVEFYLSRFAESEWCGVIRPWLEGCRGTLGRSLLVAPTRGQTQALKQRCLEESVAVLGVEFLTPGLARRKRGAPAGLPRSLELLVLRSLIAARVGALAPSDPSRRILKSLESDLEAAASDFEDLLRGGFRAEHFPNPELRAVFAEFAGWAPAHGYALGPVEDERDGLGRGPPGAPIADRLLILASGAELWPEFFGLVALARRCRSVCVVAAEPEFGGRGACAEEWVEVWEKVLSVPPVPVDVPDPAGSGSAVAELWAGAGSAGNSQILAGLSKADEMERVASHVERLLAGGSDNVAVVFPKADASHARLVRLLEARGIAYADLIGAVGTPPVEIRAQRALAELYERGCRLEELLALWPLLQTLGLVKASQAAARSACQDLFDRVQSHAFPPHVGRLAASKDEPGREVGRIAALLGEPWPGSLTPAEALRLFEAARDRLGLGEPAGWGALREFSRRAQEPMPRRALLEALRSFLPEKGPAGDAPGRSAFARVTLTTYRRAAGVAWSDTVFVEANEQCWPERCESSCWLLDEQRRSLNEAQGRFSLGLPTGDDRAAIQRRLYMTIARDTRGSVAFSAACFDEEDPEIRFDPNGWLERLMWAKGLLPEEKGRTPALERLASGRAREAVAQSTLPPGWLAVWERRRDPRAPFDGHFLGNPGAEPPRSLSPSQIQRGAEDPATLWFGAVLHLRRTDWRPFARARNKAIGELVHGLLASALGSAPDGSDFARLPRREAAAQALAEGLRELRTRWPADRYWDSFHMDVERASTELLRRVYEMGQLQFGAAEARLPAGASVPVGGDRRVGVHGRMDLVLADRGRWPGARVEIIDFKTGRDPVLSARRMASSGASLQLGVYLEAARSVGASGNVWMFKPEEPPSRITDEQLPQALEKLGLLGRHLETGIYGALTKDRTDYSRGFEWPLACAAIPAAVLREKFAATFGRACEEDDPDE
jgi:RecB family exonuclease